MIKMKAAIYVRVSTEEQYKSGYSVPAQKERLTAYCLSQDWEVFKIYEEEGKSAKDLDRPALQQMLRDMTLGLFDVVLVYRLDRLTRSVLDLYKLLEQFDKYNVKFKSATEVYDTTTATGRLFVTLVAALAQWERENLAERVKMGMLKKITMGEWAGGTTPYGYDYIDGEFKVVPHEAELVKRMYKMAFTKGMDSIAKQLNREGYRTRKGAKFAGYTVQYIVKNPFYIGKMRYREEVGDLRKPVKEQQLVASDLIEPIIEEEYFWKLQDVLEKRRDYKGKGQTGGYYFTSILKCGKCGGPMTGTVHKIGDKKVKYYRCNRKIKGSLCVMPRIQEERIVDEILKNFNEYVMGWWKETTNVEEKTSSDLTDEIFAELKNIQKQTEKYKMMFINDLIDIDELNVKIGQLREREKELKQKLNSQEEKQSHTWSLEEVEELVTSFPKLWEISNDEERKQLLASIFCEIIIDADEKAKVAPGNPKPFWIVSVK